MLPIHSFFLQTKGKGNLSEKLCFFIFKKKLKKVKWETRKEENPVPN